MIKLLKGIVIVLIILVVLLSVGLLVLSAVSAVKNKTYYKYTTVEGKIDTKYAAPGGCGVSYMEYDAEDEKIGRYEVWYPDDLEKGEQKYPAVFWANGTGGSASAEEPFLRHLASWGFIVVGNEDKNTRTGASVNSGAELLRKLNEDKESIFFHKVDVDHFGAGGHSQGGPAVFNAAAKQEQGHMFRALYTASATSSYHTQILGEDWEYDVSAISVPVFMAAGGGQWDAGNAVGKEQATDDENGIVQGICPLWSMEENYNALPDDIEKVYAIKNDADHGETYKQFDGYMTAWFLYQLKDDQEAGKAFAIGGELENNSLYRDVKTNII